MKVSGRTALLLFIIIAVIAIAQATWWTAFMAILVDEKVELAEQMGAAPEIVEQIHQQEIRRQIMVGTEGVFFLVLILVGAWLIYRALIRTEALKRQQQNFIMAITHELKTPLASIQLSIDALLSSKVSEEKKGEVLPRIEADLGRLERIVNKVLRAGRFERGDTSLKIQKTNVTQEVQNVLLEFEHSQTDTTIELSTSLAPDIVADLDRIAFRAVVESVLENAVRYSSRKPAGVEVRLTSSDRWAILTIADDGIGLSAADCEAVFQRFYRVGNELTRRAPGTGLGLYLARELMSAHGGTITARSEGPDRGATFEIRIPLAEES